jgi:purine-binding chemotaxis protein CheW
LNAAPPTTARDEHLIAFRLGDETFAVDIALVHEIVRLCPITRIPRALGDVEGVINLRGRIVPIVDMRRRLGLPSIERDGATRIMIVEIGEMNVGAVVDSVTGVIRMAETDIDTPETLFGDPETDYVRGVGKYGEQLVILLDIVKSLSFANAA